MQIFSILKELYQSAQQRLIELNSKWENGGEETLSIYLDAESGQPYQEHLVLDSLMDTLVVMLPYIDIDDDRYTQYKSDKKKTERRESLNSRKIVQNFFLRDWKKNMNRKDGGWTAEDWRYAAEKLVCEEDSCPIFVNYRDIHTRLTPFSICNTELFAQYEKTKKQTAVERG